LPDSIFNITKMILINAETGRYAEGLVYENSDIAKRLKNSTYPNRFDHNIPAPYDVRIEIKVKSDIFHAFSKENRTLRELSSQEKEALKSTFQASLTASFEALKDRLDPVFSEKKIRSVILSFDEDFLAYRRDAEPPVVTNLSIPFDGVVPSHLHEQIFGSNYGYVDDKYYGNKTYDHLVHMLFKCKRTQWPDQDKLLLQPDSPLPLIIQEDVKWYQANASHLSLPQKDKEIIEGFVNAWLKFENSRLTNSHSPYIYAFYALFEVFA